MPNAFHRVARNASLEAVPRWGSALVVLAGADALLGARFGQSLLSRLVPGWSLTDPWTAAALVFAGLSLHLQQTPAIPVWRRRIGQALAIAPLLIGVAALVSMLHPTLASGGALAEASSIWTALTLPLIGLALLTLDLGPKGWRHPPRLLVLLPLVVSQFVFFGCLYGSLPSSAAAAWLPDGVGSALCFWMLCLGIMLARPGVGVKAFLTGDDLGATLMRRFLPLTIIALCLLGWLRSLGDRADLYNNGLGTAILVCCAAILLAVVIQRNSGSLVRAENERKRLAGHVLALLESTSGGIFGLDTSGRFTFVNRAAGAMLRYTPDELLGRNAHELLHAGGANGTKRPEFDFTRFVASSTRGADRVTADEFRCSDGTELPVEFTASPIHQDSKIQGFAITFHDVTERREAEDSIRRSEAQLVEAQQLAHVGSWEADHLTGRTTWSAELYRVAGIDAHDVQPSFERLLESVHADDRSQVRHQLDLALDDHQPHSLEHRLVWPDGEVRLVQTRVRVVADSQGVVTTSQGTATDITALKHAEQALRLSEERFRTMVETTNDWIWSRDLEGRTTYSNPAVAGILGYTPAEMQGLPWSQHVHREDFGKLQELLPAMSGQKRGWSGLTLRWRHRDGSDHLLESSAQPLLDDRGEVIGFLGADRDVTERRRVEGERARLQQLELKEEFISHVSHELRSPVTAIYQFITILLDGLAGEINAEQREYLEIVHRNVQQLSKMIGDLLEVSRAQAGKLGITQRRVELKPILDECLSSFRASLETNQVTITSQTASDLPAVLADPHRVQQVLVNLVGNARKATAAGGSITLQADISRDEPGVLCIAVTDTGRGIPAAERELIFDQLYQADTMIDSSRKGLGLGLYISKELVTRQGGRMWVESEVGLGSTFYFTLPIFSMESQLAPLLNSTNARGDAIALIDIHLFPIDAHALSETDDNALTAAWNVLESCHLPDLDLLLPRMAAEHGGENFFVVSFAEPPAVDVLVRRIEGRLALCEELVNVGLDWKVSPIPIDPDAASSLEAAMSVAERLSARIEEVLNGASIERVA